MHPNYDGILVWFILHESATVRMLSLAPSLSRLMLVALFFFWVNRSPSRQASQDYAGGIVFFGKSMLVALSWWVKIVKFLLLPRIVVFLASSHWAVPEFSRGNGRKTCSF